MTDPAVPASIFFDEFIEYASERGVGGARFYRTLRGGGRCRGCGCAFGGLLGKRRTCNLSLRREPRSGDIQGGRDCALSQITSPGFAGSRVDFGELGHTGGGGCGAISRAGMDRGAVPNAGLRRRLDAGKAAAALWVSASRTAPAGGHTMKGFLRWVCCDVPAAAFFEAASTASIPEIPPRRDHETTMSLK